MGFGKTVIVKLLPGYTARHHCVHFIALYFLGHSGLEKLLKRRGRCQIWQIQGNKKNNRYVFDFGLLQAHIACSTRSTFESLALSVDSGTAHGSF